MAPSNWHAFPHAQSDYSYEASALADQWPLLHAGDREPFPDAAYIDALLKANPAWEPVGGDSAERLAERLQDGWRRFHAGDFAAAVATGEALGPLGATLLGKAQATYAHYLVNHSPEKQRLFQDVADRMAALVDAWRECANGHYLLAFALGRYSQEVSIAAAIKQGLAGRVKQSLETVLSLNDDHADAHTALGTYHAEILDKIGSVLGSMTYGASREDGLAHYRRGLALAPRSVSALTEYADGLLMMYGKSKVRQATELYEQAVELKPYDALSRLDWERAKEQLN